MPDNPIRPFYGTAIDDALAAKGQALSAMVSEVSKALSEAEAQHAAEDARIQQVRRSLVRLRAAVAGMYF